MIAKGDTDSWRDVDFGSFENSESPVDLVKVLLVAFVLVLRARRIQRHAHILDSLLAVVLAADERLALVERERDLLSATGQDEPHETLTANPSRARTARSRLRRGTS